MVIQTSAQLIDKVKELKEQRKNGTLDPKGYYRELLSVLTNLTDTLIDEVEHLDDSQVRAQIPLLVVLLDDQIAAFKARE